MTNLRGLNLLSWYHLLRQINKVYLIAACAFIGAIISVIISHIVVAILCALAYGLGRLKGLKWRN